MKATVLGQLDPQTAEFSQEKLSLLCSSNYLGDVEPITLDPAFVSYKKLLEFAEHNGFKYHNVKYYNSSSLLPLCGSVGMHTDDGMGLIISWIIHQEDLSDKLRSTYNFIQLAHPGGVIELSVGDVFVFDANKPHAWISNSRCVLVQLAVKKPRVRKKV